MGTQFIHRVLQKRLLVHRHQQRMRIEREFEQRGAGSWEANDENRAFIHRRRAGIDPRPRRPRDRNRIA